MKRIGIAAGLLLFLGAAGLLSLPALVYPDDLKAAFSNQIEAIISRPAQVRGNARLRVAPLPRVTLEDVAFEGRAGPESPPVLTIDRIEGRLKLAPLLLGRIVVEDFVIDGPVLDLRRDAGGTGNWSIYEADDFDAISVDNPDIGRIAVTGGALNYTDRSGEKRLSITDIDGVVDWPAFLARTDIALSGSVGGRRTRLAVKAARAGNLLFGGSTIVETTIDNELGTFALDGDLSNGQGPRFNGQIRLDASAFPDLLSWLGFIASERYLPTALTTNGQLALDTDGLSLSSAALNLDGQPADGAFDVRFGGPVPEINGSLAFETLRLDPIIQRVVAAPATENPSPANDTTEDTPAIPPTALQTSERTRSPEVLDTAPFVLTRILPDEAAADLRLSATRMEGFGAVLDNAALTLALRDRRIDIAIGNGEFGGGAIAGSLAFDHPAGGVPVATAALSGTGVRLESALPPPITARWMAWLGGAASFSLDMQTAGEDWRSFRANMNGSGTLVLRDGQIAVPERVAFDSDRLPAPAMALAAQGVRAAGAETFDELSTTFRADRATVTLSAIRLDGRRIALNGTGTLRTRDGTLDLDLSASRSDAEPSASIPLRLEGTVFAPRVNTDVIGLTRMLRE